MNVDIRVAPIQFFKYRVGYECHTPGCLFPCVLLPPFPCVCVCVCNGRSLLGTDNYSQLLQICNQHPTSTLLTIRTLPDCYVSHMVNYEAAQSLSLELFLPVFFVDSYFPFSCDLQYPVETLQSATCLALFSPENLQPIASYQAQPSVSNECRTASLLLFVCAYHKLTAQISGSNNVQRAKLPLSQ